MKAYELHPHEQFASVTLVDRPSPGPLGPHEVRVRVHAVSLNYRDLIIAKNAVHRSAPLVPTSDGAGEVIEVGAAVQRVRVGDAVAGSFFPTWTEGQLSAAHHARALGGGEAHGMLAEEVVLPETAWVKLPDHFDFVQGATLPCAGLTAWHALFVAAETKPGDRVLVQGTGGVSIFALQLARAAGAEVIATSSSDEKRVRLRELGAADTLDYRTDEAWGETVQTRTGGVDTVVEVGGAGTFDQSVKALRFGGTLALIGVLTGTGGTINTHALVHKLIQVRGVYVGSVPMFDDFVKALSRNRITPIVDRVFAFDEARQAYEYQASGAHFGKVVIRVGA
jgi:NADPH:quinone reductase-like Zn-dependent oxidoreductase